MKRQKCEECGKSDRTILLNIEIVDGDLQKMFLCKRCNKKFITAKKPVVYYV